MAELSLHRTVELLGDWRRGGHAAERLAATLRTLVLDGRIPAGTRLPAERTFAGGLGVSRATVSAAYERLRAEGYLLSTLGSGSWVTIPSVPRQALDDAPPAELDLTVASLPAPTRILELAEVAVAKLPAWLDHHGYSPLGLAPLREAIAARYTARGLPTSADQILITAGALQAIDLTIRALLPRGRNALVEIPSYPAVLDAIRRAGARLRSAPVSSAGWDLDQLEAAAARHQPALAYLIPDFHNPTGALMDQAERGRALSALNRAGGYTVADETFSELNLDGVQLAQPFAATGRGERVVTVGSLSKAVWGGLRVGWARAEPALIRRLASARGGVDLSSPVLEQLIATEALSEFDALLAERRELARVRRVALSDALQRHPPRRLALLLPARRPRLLGADAAAGRHQPDGSGTRARPGVDTRAAVRDRRTARAVRAPAVHRRPAELESAVRIIAELAPSVSAGREPGVPLSSYSV